ncbi:MAG: sensor histidine kinase [Candidatus Bipolaricaulis sp.]|nr:sensor histidine kinase [Candidatus Bipolaricaulis sp.]
MDRAAGFAERKAGVVRTILVRRLTLGVFSAVALVVLFTSRLSYKNPLFYSPVLWFLLTFPFKAMIERLRSERALHWAHTGFYLAEVILITVLVHFMGGSTWIGNIFYLFTVLYANYFLPRVYGALVTGWVVACYATLVLLEAGGILPHRSLFALAGDPYQSPSYNVATILAGTVALYAVVAFTVRTFAAIDAKKNRVLAKREQALVQMSKRLLGAQDEERRRIARDLHDGLIQSLAAIKLHLAPAKSRLGEEEYSHVTGIVDEAIVQTRTLAYSIRPPLLDDLGLVPSLDRLGESVGEENELAVHVESDLDGRLDREAEGLLYHVAREALENVVRHAKASRVAIRVSSEGAWVRLSIEDDGIGIAPDGPRGLGLRGIEERVTIAGGTVAIASAPERGTIVAVEVPCGDDADRDRR